MLRIVKPRLNDYFDVGFTQSDVDFAIPHLAEDIPLYIDPFLLWSSANTQYQDLHRQLIEFFHEIRTLALSGQDVPAIRSLLASQEPRELGLGYAFGHKRGSTVGPKLAQNIVTLFRSIPQLESRSLNHIEEIQLLVPGIAEDRISDMAASVLKSFLVDFTSRRARELGIPARMTKVPAVYDHDRKAWLPGVSCELPYNPLDDSPLLFAPLDWLRHLPWINYEDYYRSFYAPFVLPPDHAGRRASKEVVLAYNRANYAAVQRYVREKERLSYQCKPDPIFEPLRIETVRRKFTALRALPTGMEDDNDQKYEELICDILSSLLYPELAFADRQVRTISGSHVRDLIFYNDGKIEFCNDIRNRFEARQIVFELKNVKKLDRDHINQLFRYLGDEFGKFGVIVTRNPAPRSILQNAVDLYSAKRCVILGLDDADVELMINLADSGRRPIEALKRKFVEFTRMLPS